MSHLNWTVQMLEALRSLRADNVPIRTCARRMEEDQGARAKQPKEPRKTVR
jgi:hypothetical protein